MHLAVDAVGVKYGGGATVLRDFLQAAVGDARFERITVFCSPRKTRLVAVEASTKVFECEQELAESGAVPRFWWSQRGLAGEVAKTGAHALLAFTGVAVGSASVPAVTFIQQSLPYCPEALRACGVGVRLRMAVVLAAMRRSCWRSSFVIAQTPTMKDWITARLHLPESRVRVIVPCPTEFTPGQLRCDALAQMNGVPADRRLLYVGSTAPYKNLKMAVKALPLVREFFPCATLFLTCAPDDPLCSHEGVVGLGYLGPGELEQVYAMATLLVMPSLVESGNLTMMEAMAAGTPVLAADRPYAHDLCEEAAMFFDPHDPAELAAKTIGLLLDDSRRRDLVRKGRSLVMRRRANTPYKQLLDAICQAAERRQPTSPPLSEQRTSVTQSEHGEPKWTRAR